MEKYEQVEKSRKTIITNNLFGGIAWGFGATIGASILFAIFGIILSKINLIPVIGNFVMGIIKFINENQPVNI